MDQKTYLSERIDDQINWYEQKSKKYQSRYKLLKVIVILISVTIPFLAGLIKGEMDWFKIAVGIGGVAIAAIEGMLSLFQYQDLWAQYRLTAELLKREKIIFLTKSGHYQNNNSAFQDFVNRSEAIMSSENQAWIESQKKQEQESSTEE